MPGESHLNSYFLEQRCLYTLKISFCFKGPSPAPASREDKFYQSSVSKVIKKCAELFQREPDTQACSAVQPSASAADDWKQKLNGVNVNKELE